MPELQQPFEDKARRKWLQVPGDLIGTVQRVGARRRVHRDVELITGMHHLPRRFPLQPLKQEPCRRDRPRSANQHTHSSHTPLSRPPLWSGSCESAFPFRKRSHTEGTSLLFLANSQSCCLVSIYQLFTTQHTNFVFRWRRRCIVFRPPCPSIHFLAFLFRWKRWHIVFRPPPSLLY